MTIPHDGSKVSQWTTTPKEILNGCIKSNPNDKSFGVLPDTGAISDALAKIVPVRSAPKKKAAKKK